MKLSKNAKGLSYLSIKLKLNLEIRSFKGWKQARFLNIFVTNFQNRKLTEIKENQRGTEDDSHLKRREDYIVGEKTLKKPTLLPLPTFSYFRTAEVYWDGR